jgi:hypothetical protein
MSDEALKIIKTPLDAANYIKKSVFEALNSVNVNGHTEQKNNLTYLSWAWAWAEVKKLYPDTIYTIYERETEHGPVNYFTDGRTCWVKTGVTINGLEHIEELPVMDFKNKAIPYEAVTSTDVNKTIQRSLTKACARHGLGLYIYAGEDLPEEEKGEVKKTNEAEITEELKKLYKEAGGKDFNKWVESCGGITPATWPVMKSKLLQQINAKAEEKK